MVVESIVHWIVTHVVSCFDKQVGDHALWFGIDSYEIVSGVEIDSQENMSFTWIDTCFGNGYGVGHLLHSHLIHQSFRGTVMNENHHSIKIYSKTLSSKHWYHAKKQENFAKNVEVFNKHFKPHHISFN